VHRYPSTRVFAGEKGLYRDSLRFTSGAKMRYAEGHPLVGVCVSVVTRIGDWDHASLFS